jgi:hypothetical protein
MTHTPVITNICCLLFSVAGLELQNKLDTLSHPNGMKSNILDTQLNETLNHNVYFKKVKC